MAWGDGGWTLWDTGDVVLVASILEAGSWQEIGDGSCCDGGGEPPDFSFSEIGIWLS